MLKPRNSLHSRPREKGLSLSKDVIAVQPSSIQHMNNSFSCYEYEHQHFNLQRSSNKAKTSNIQNFPMKSPTNSHYSSINKQSHYLHPNYSHHHQSKHAFNSKHKNKNLHNHQNHHNHKRSPFINKSLQNLNQSILIEQTPHNNTQNINFCAQNQEQQRGRHLDSQHDQTSTRDLWQQAETISQMIKLLVQYQKICQQKMDLTGAEQARKKINQLKKQEIEAKKKQLQYESRSSLVKTDRENRSELKQFQSFWAEKMSQAELALNDIKQSHIEQQKQQLKRYIITVQSQPIPPVKYSSKILQMRKNLTQLIKSRKYKQAQHLKSLLQKSQQSQQQQWHKKHKYDKKESKIKQYQRRQQIELQALDVKLRSSYNDLLMEKEKQYDRQCIDLVCDDGLIAAGGALFKGRVKGGDWFVVVCLG